MISRAHRFHGLGSLRPVYQHGQVARSSAIVLKYTLNRRRLTYRCAVVVSKKVSKSAVVRNRIRRRVYEQIRLHDGAITAPYDLVLTIHSDLVAEMPTDKLSKALNTLLLQAGVVS